MNNRDKEELRRALLEALVLRQGTSMRLSGIVRAVGKEVWFTFTPEEAEAELHTLRGLGFADFIFDELGSTKWWRPTAQGVLHLERQS